MKKLIYLFSLASLFLSASLFTSCEKEYYVPFERDISDVSFTDDLIPIFDASCNMVGCHNTGGYSPDLTAANAYDDLYDEDMIDLNNPENSLLYTSMKGLSSPTMPFSGPLPNGEPEAVLVWIQEGGLNN